MVNPSNKWRVIIVENELLARIGIKNFITSRYPDFEVVADVDNTVDALRLIEEDKGIHGVFLDIHFDCEFESKGISAGFDLAHALNNMPNAPWVVFMTGKAEEYAREAHDYDTLGFLNKPFNRAEVDKLFDRIRKNKPLSQSTSTGHHFILIQHSRTNNFRQSEKCETRVQPNEIRYIHSNKGENTVRIHLMNGEVLDKNNNTLSRWEEVLAKFDFFKVGKSCVINLRQVRTIKKTDPCWVSFKLGDELLPVAAEYLDKLQLALQKIEP